MFNIFNYIISNNSKTKVLSHFTSLLIKIREIEQKVGAKEREGI